ncbi:MAG: carbohydrate ABC transporter permease [Armatimonadota bacterium]
MNKTVENTIKYAILIALALFMTFPFIWLLLTSIKTTGNMFKIETFADIIPWPVSFENFIEVMKTVPLIPKFLFNTVIITFWGMLLGIVISALAAYPLARFKFPGRNFIFFMFISTMMLPTQANMIVNFITIRKLGLFDTYIAVILPALVNVFGIFLMRQAYLTIPGELEDAGRLDGCGELSLWWHVMLPMTRPALGALSIFTFVAYWNTFMWPLVILKTESKYPFAVGLTYLSNMFASDFRTVAAAAVISMVPIIIVFILMQKQFIKGITAGAVK